MKSHEDQPTPGRDHDLPQKQADMDAHLARVGHHEPKPGDRHRHTHAHGSDEDLKHDGHGHDHQGDEGHRHDGHTHDHRHGLWDRIAGILHLNSHSHGREELIADRAFTATDQGIRTVWLAMAILLLTSVLQVIVVSISGSVALLADTLHNIGDGLNSLPLLIAFYLARRAATRRYTYGYGRAEDVAGVFIVLSILVSAGIVFWESFQKLINPAPLSNLGWVALAAVVGFVGNEAVALMQIRVGRRIGSAALVADGQHARTDGLTSLAVLLAAGGAWLGIPILDPIIGFTIGVAILAIAWSATRSIWFRLMDAVEPDLLEQAEAVVEAQPGVLALRRLRMRWMGHTLYAEAIILVRSDLTTAESHQIAEGVRHALFHESERLGEVVVHVDPWSGQRDTFHEATAHHEPLPRRLE